MKDAAEEIVRRAETYLQVRAALLVLAPDIEEELVEQIASIIVENLCR